MKPISLIVTVFLVTGTVEVNAIAQQSVDPADYCTAIVIRETVWLSPSGQGKGSGPLHAGETFLVTGGNADPHKVCEHMGECAARSDVKFSGPCKRVGGPDNPYGPYYGWEPVR